MADTYQGGVDMTKGNRAYEKVQQLQAELAERVADLTTGEEWERWLDVVGRFHDYSWNNTLLIWMQRPDATRVAGYKAWQEMGRQVRKGERGIRILAPSTRVCRHCDGTGQREPDPCGFCGGGGRVVRFRSVAVFDVSQTDGEPLPEPPCRRLAGAGPDGAWGALAALVRDAGAQVVRAPLPGDVNGRTSWGEATTVTVRPDLSAAQAVKTLAHEYAHVLMHHPADPERPADRGHVEVEAESVAYVVMQALGVDSADYSLGYVATWSLGDIEVVQSTAKRVVATASKILDRIEARAGEPVEAAAAA